MSSTSVQSTRSRLQRRGVTLHDPDRACPGYVLYSPMLSAGDVYLVGLDGDIAHHWRLPYPPGLWGYLLPNGNLFYGGRDPHPGDLHGEWFRQSPFRGGIMIEVDWEGNIVWEHRDPSHHHDARRTESGGALYLTVERMDPTLVASVKGGSPGSDAEGMWADVIVEVDAAGRRVWEWHAAEHLDPERDVMNFNDRRREWTHGNTVVPLPGDQVLASFRNISTVCMINRPSGEITWRCGPPLLTQQHDPTLLENGNVLIFDNGAHRPTIGLPFSRVVEIEPTTNTIAWEYIEQPPMDFFSPMISGARRLPNGNTLITEGNSGRMFQVTADGQIVWEYTNPYFQQEMVGRWRVGENAVFRATHYLPEQLAALRFG